MRHQAHDGSLRQPCPPKFDWLGPAPAGGGSGRDVSPNFKGALMCSVRRASVLAPWWRPPHYADSTDITDQSTANASREMFGMAVDLSSTAAVDWGFPEMSAGASRIEDEGLQEDS